MKKIKKILITPLFLFGILIPALFADDINIQDIIFPSILKTDEFTPDSSINEVLIPFVNLSQRQEFSKIPTGAHLTQKVFFDEDSPSLPTAPGTTRVCARIEIHSVKNNVSTFVNYSDIYLINGSLII